MKHFLIWLLCSIFALSNITPHSMAAVVEGYPDLLICEVPDGTIVLYLQQVEKGGDAIYMSPNSKYVTLKTDGKIYRSEKEMQGCERSQFSK